METLISLDFEFEPMSLMYGRFLIEVFETCPDTVIKNVNSLHPYTGGETKFVHVAVPEELAVVLKLKFGAHLRPNRNPITPPSSNIMILKNRSTLIDRSHIDIDYKNNVYMADYIIGIERKTYE